MKKILLGVVLALCSTALLFGCSPADNFDTYIENVSAYTAPDGSKLFQNSNAEAYEQTVVHDMMMSHFAAPLATGTTTKKAIFIGFDGCRVDALKYANDVAATSALLKVRGAENGTLVFANAGGPEGDTAKKQATSTAPGWASLLTGKWALEEGGHGVSDNNMYKKAEVETFLTKIARIQKPGTVGTYSSSFTTSWREHQSKTYFHDIVKASAEGTNIEYKNCIDDQDTYYDVLQRVSGYPNNEDKDTDVVFFTLEETDHSGHSIGFGIQNDDYIRSYKQQDEYGFKIVETIENRPSYATEDWLIVMSTDHGGYKKSHGGQTILERTTWIATNRKDYLAK